MFIFPFLRLDTIFLFAVVGPVEADPEYQLIVDSNDMAVQIDNETS